MYFFTHIPKHDYVYSVIVIKAFFYLKELIDKILLS